MSKNLNSITIVRNYFYSIDVDQQRNRAYLTLTGYWQNQSDLTDYIHDIEIGLGKLSSNFTLLVDLTQYRGTSSELQYLHVEAQKLAMRAGLSRIAEVFYSNPVVKMLWETYSKESGANTMAFNNRVHAERWLDLY